MEKQEFVQLFKQACYRTFALNGIDIYKLAEIQAADENSVLCKEAEDVKQSLVSHIMGGLSNMNTDLGTLMMFGAAPAVAGIGAGYAAEKMTAPPSVNIDNARRAELLDAYDKAIKEVQTRIDVRKRRAGVL